MRRKKAKWHKRREEQNMRFEINENKKKESSKIISTLLKEKK